MTNTKRVLLLKNKTVPIDPYESNFEQNDFEPVFIPMIQHMHLPLECLHLLQNDAYMTQLKHIVISSQRTVECLNESVVPNLSVSQQDALLQKTVYTVGPATASFLQRCGFKDVRGGIDAGNGSILADVIISDLKNDATTDFSSMPTLLLLVGETRRDIIPKKLASAGLKSQEVVTYKTEILDNNLQRFVSLFNSQCWVVFFSSQGTDEIIDYLKDKNAQVASIGPTTDEFLLSRGIRSHVVSAKPEPVSLIQSLKSV
ncbi:LANO_0H17106g1_1 [Lachancea nothofagi CBS 11611]|uniref:LANO_0H17106g1_1 n=1 Tax=Lachancea nothofagi CBS 11611 TaxID=1266666 RepID=A0A1G4KMV6_9SACH|nr:LANO_0H17106g1_1 [Lachancea nothofagi CBS 11611]